MYFQAYLNVLAVFLPGVLGTGCSTAYYIQAARGQMAIFNRAEPIEVTLNRDNISEAWKRLLREVPLIKTYGETKFRLKPTPNYQKFVKWEDDVLTWVVTACPKDDLKAKNWSFPIVGNTSYLGFFDRAAALEYASRVEKEEGLDTAVRGAAAYSTLGWFADPIISTMLGKGPEARGYLVETVFHESVHATYYVKGQSAFNESTAEFLGERMAEIYLRDSGDLQSLDAYLKSVQRSEMRADRLFGAYEELKALYADKQPWTTVEPLKLKILSRLQEDLGLKQMPNNATVMQFQTYRQGRAEIAKAFEHCGRDPRKLLDFFRTFRPEDFGGVQSNDFGPAITGQIAKRAC